MWPGVMYVVTVTSPSVIFWPSVTTMSFRGLNCAGELSFATRSQSAADMAMRAFGYVS